MKTFLDCSHLECRWDLRRFKASSSGQGFIQGFRRDIKPTNTFLVKDDNSLAVLDGAVAQLYPPDSHRDTTPHIPVHPNQPIPTSVISCATRIVQEISLDYEIDTYVVAVRPRCGWRSPSSTARTKSWWWTAGNRVQSNRTGSCQRQVPSNYMYLSFG